MTDNFCDYCGNEKHDKSHNICRDMDCYWFSHWKVDKNNPEAVEKESYIRGEINDMNW